MEQLMKLVEKWTRNSQSSISTDDERVVYQICAKELFEAIQATEKTEVSG